MSRHLASKLSGTSAARWLPLAHMTEFHKFAGIHLVGQLFVVLLIFMGYVGKLCSAFRADPTVVTTDHCTGPSDDGVDFTSEIMSTGYALTGVSLLIGLTALTCTRRTISYEVRDGGGGGGYLALTSPPAPTRLTCGPPVLAPQWFIGIHHLFIPFYAIAIAHTFDPRGREDFHLRMQVVLWVCAPIAIYSWDRYLRNVTIVTMPVTTVRLLKSPRTLILRLARPPQWTFSAGQHVRMRIPGVSSLEWHPFTIASCPDSTQLEFIIRAIEGSNPKQRTWTAKAFELFEALAAARVRDVLVDVEGPYGSVMENAFALPNVALFASGTGIVPMLSVLRELYSSEHFVVHTNKGDSPQPSSRTAPRIASLTAAAEVAMLAQRAVRGVMTEGTGGQWAYAPPERLSLRRLSVLERAAIATVPPPLERLQTVTVTHVRAQSVDAARRRRGAKRAWAVLRSYVCTGTLRPVFFEAARRAAAARRMVQSTSLRFIESKHRPSALPAEAPVPSIDVLRRFMGSRAKLTAYWLAATRGEALFAASLAFGLLQFLLLCLEVSFYTSGLGTETQEAVQLDAVLWPYTVLDALSVVALVGFLAVIVLSPLVLRETSSSQPLRVLVLRALRGAVLRAGQCCGILVRGMAPGAEGTHSEDTNSGRATLLHLIALTAQAVCLASVFGLRRNNDIFVGVFGLLRAYQIVYHYVTNPLFYIHSAVDHASQKRAASFMTGASLVWVNRTPDMFVSFYDELLQLVSETSAHCPGLISVRCYITAATKAERAAISELIASTALEGCVFWERPDVRVEIERICSPLATPALGGGSFSGGVATSASPPHSPTAAAAQDACDAVRMQLLRDAALSVYVCGNPALASTVRVAFMQARKSYDGRLVLAYGSETVFG